MDCGSRLWNYKFLSTKTPSERKKPWEELSSWGLQLQGFAQCWIPAGSGPSSILWHLHSSPSSPGHINSLTVSYLFSFNIRLWKKEMLPLCCITPMSPPVCLLFSTYCTRVLLWNQLHSKIFFPGNTQSVGRWISGQWVDPVSVQWCNCYVGCYRLMSTNHSNMYFELISIIIYGLYKVYLPVWSDEMMASYAYRGKYDSDLCQVGLNYYFTTKLWAAWLLFNVQVQVHDRDFALCPLRRQRDQGHAHVQDFT